MTITGVINGPTSTSTWFISSCLSTRAAPTMGQLIPVVYAPNNPDKWFFAPSVSSSEQAQCVTASAVLVATSGW